MDQSWEQVPPWRCIPSPVQFYIKRDLLVPRVCFCTCASAFPSAGLVSPVLPFHGPHEHLAASFGERTAILWSCCPLGFRLQAPAEAAGLTLSCSLGCLGFCLFNALCPHCASGSHPLPSHRDDLLCLTVVSILLL